MIQYDDGHIQALMDAKDKADLKVSTLGQFHLVLDDNPVPDNWGRDKAIQLFQFFLISRNRLALHKEQIIDRLWDESGSDQVFKVALHGINKTIEPNKKSRGQTRFIQRQGATYKLDMSKIWLDSQALESYIEIGNHVKGMNNELAIIAFQLAINLYKGPFLPNRIYEDWTTTERERIQIFTLGAYISLAELLLEEQPNESIRLTEEALNIDPTWEEAYRIQMAAHIANGNRPQAIRTYKRCVDVLDKEFGIAPLPKTVGLFESFIG